MHQKSLKSAFLSLASLSFCFHLCGCSTTSETFDCPTGKGVGCKSISQVNSMVDRGVLEGDAEKGKPSILLPFSPPLMATDPSGAGRGKASGDKSLSHPAGNPLSDDLSVHRIQEELLRVWVSPYQDAHGNLHEGSLIHIILKPGYWEFSSHNPSAKSGEAP